MPVEHAESGSQISLNSRQEGNCLKSQHKEHGQFPTLLACLVSAQLFHVLMGNKLFCSSCGELLSTRRKSSALRQGLITLLEHEDSATFQEALDFRARGGQSCLNKKNIVPLAGKRR